MKNLTNLFERNNIEYKIIKESYSNFHITAKHETINIEVKRVKEEGDYVIHLDMTDDVCSEKEWLIYEECHSIKEMTDRVKNILQIK